ncbi:unnamed protein product [Moneuplotes crassus]|uniref:Uncharacterized protein n=2 Tax=Euplotes crassus TaxID=5936 RepID=A0AAD1X2Z2_EUPCR|nr:unnamed protein product [Moneuplotes crassus]
MEKKDKTGKRGKGDEEKARIAIVNEDRCKPKKCGLECKRHCPVNKTGKVCIEVEKKSKISYISEVLCIGCAICVKKCPYDAIHIINLPKNLRNEQTHRYGPNSFKLHRLPIPRSGEVLGLVGTNGIGKSTALKILSGNLKPNLGSFEDPPDWKAILKYFRGSELQSFFTKLLEDNLRAVTKVQYVDDVAKQKKAQGIVKKKLKAADKRKVMDEAIEYLDLGNVLEREVKNLSGGELQRFIIAMVYVQRADIYMFDEPSSYLDVKQRLKAAQAIRNLVQHDNYIICVEHDLSILDYLSDFICCLYGMPGAYGVVTMPSGVKEGINIFLAGFIPSENMRFRTTELTFKVSQDKRDDEEEKKEGIVKRANYQYPGMTKTLGPFKLTVNPGSFSNSEILVMLGENGTGKSTLIHILAGILKPDDEDTEMPKLSISIKPQKIAPKFTESVRSLLDIKLGTKWNSPLFKTEVLKPLDVESLLDNNVQTLSGGELQRVAITLALGKPCDIYLIDEPSAYLDSEQRIIAAKVLKRWIMNTKRSAFIVEHDFIMASYLADKVIVFDGTPAKETSCTTPEGLVSGMNRFLEMLEITFRRDPTNFRPRINKMNSQKDQEQKASGCYFLVDEAQIEKIGKERAAKKAKAKAEKEARKLAKKRPRKKDGQNDSDDEDQEPEEDHKEEANEEDDGQEDSDDSEGFV